MAVVLINTVFNGCLTVLKFNNMKTVEKTIISIQALINAPVNTVWKFWTIPGDVVKWNNAAEDWLTTTAENDFTPGGKFSYRMEAKDGSFGFDFKGTYSEITTNKLIKYTIDDGRKVEIIFSDLDNKTEITEYFEAENIHSVEMQRSGWQSILFNFKKYAESNV